MNISGKTQLIGLIGWPVSHSFSPAMHNAAAADLGLDFVYVAMPVHPDDVETAVRGLPALGFRGFNVTVPHKQAVMPFLDEIEAGAKAIGAVNTIVISKQYSVNSEQSPTPNPQSPIPSLTGYNTDWSGFLADLEGMNVEVSSRSCLVLGAGGSARAVAYGLAQAGGQVQVLARRVAQAQQLVAEIAPHIDGDGWLNAWPLAELETAVRATANAATAPLIINTTPLGMSPNVETSVWPDDLAFPAGSFAYDLVYNPATTRFMQQAQAAGCQAANGLGMLLHQGAQAFAKFTGQEPDLDVMRKALDT
jgi:shikimate dehydrogenase